MPAVCLDTEPDAEEKTAILGLMVIIRACLPVNKESFEAAANCTVVLLKEVTITSSYMKPHARERKVS